MNLREASLFALAPVLAGIAHGPAPETIAFAPAAGAEISKVFREETTWNIDSIEQTVDGSSGGPESPDMTVSAKRSVRVTDTYRAIGEGRPLKLGRTVDGLGGSSSIGIAMDNLEERYEVELESALDGEELEFEWDGDEGSYRCRLAGDEKQDSALLEGLQEDMDLRALLPPDPVEEGDSWKVDLSEAGNLFAPGGAWKLVPESLPDGAFRILEREDVLGSSVIPLAEMGSEWEGEITATWSETVTEDDVSIAVVQLELDATYEADLVEALAARCEHVDYESDRRDQKYAVKGSVQGEGTLRWNLGAGHYQSLTLECEQSVHVRMSYGKETVAGVFDISAEVEVSGTTRFTVE